MLPFGRTNSWPGVYFHIVFAGHKPTSEVKLLPTISCCQEIIHLQVSVLKISGMCPIFVTCSRTKGLHQHGLACPGIVGRNEVILNANIPVV